MFKNYTFLPLDFTKVLSFNSKSMTIYKKLEEYSSKLALKKQKQKATRLRQAEALKKKSRRRKKKKKS